MPTLQTLPELTTAIRAHLDAIDALVAQYKCRLGHATPYDHVLAVVQDVFNVSAAHILCRCRQSKFVQARHTVWFALHGLGWSPKTIAAQFKVHHAAIHHAIKSITSRADTDPTFKHRLETVLRRCSAPLS